MDNFVLTIIFALTSNVLAFPTMDEEVRRIDRSIAWNGGLVAPSFGNVLPQGEFLYSGGYLANGGGGGGVGGGYYPPNNGYPPGGHYPPNGQTNCGYYFNGLYYPNCASYPNGVYSPNGGYYNCGYYQNGLYFPNCASYPVGGGPAVGQARPPAFGQGVHQPPHSPAELSFLSGGQPQGQVGLSPSDIPVLAGQGPIPVGPPFKSDNHENGGGLSHAQATAMSGPNGGSAQSTATANSNLNQNDNSE